MPRITKETQCCISIAERPGNFGSLFFNTLFDALGLDFIYKPFKVEAKDLAIVISAIRALDMRSCGVSMPHKETVLALLDHLDATAEAIGAVNTIVNRNRELYGYNSDYLGTIAATQRIIDVKDKSLLVLGSGGMARAMIFAFKKLGAREIIVSSRDDAHAEALANRLGLQYHAYVHKDQVKADILVNATPVGMSAEDPLIVPHDVLSNYKGVIDAVISTDKTTLAKVSINLGLSVVQGSDIAIEQAIEQFRIYTGLEAPPDLVTRIRNSYFNTT